MAKKKKDEVTAELADVATVDVTFQPTPKLTWFTGYYPATEEGGRCWINCRHPGTYTVPKLSVAKLLAKYPMNFMLSDEASAEVAGGKPNDNPVPVRGDRPVPRRGRR